MRKALAELAGRLFVEGIPLRVYEAGRTPQRQRDLYLQGRNSPSGRIVTKAKPWESYHQFGMAVDHVFWIDGLGWTWNEPKPGMWARYTQLADKCGLRSLSFEKPHVELPLRLADLQSGVYPPGGDDSWRDWLEAQIESWGPGAREVSGLMMPGAPPQFTDRPALVA
jgi:peptidoglycan L-alanyl-D-glutamate endopeptidase CwlK